MKVKLDTAKLDQIARKSQKRAEGIIKTAALEVESRAKQRAPVDTGALKNSLRATEREKLLWQVADGVEYGIFQELGTSRMPAHPFLVPALESIRDWFIEKTKGLATP
jgi:HK97 gp10 family phage protein